MVKYNRAFFSLKPTRLAIKVWSLKAGGLWQQVQLYLQVGSSARNMWSLKTGCLPWQWSLKTGLTVPYFFQSSPYVTAVRTDYCKDTNVIITVSTSIAQRTYHAAQKSIIWNIVYVGIILWITMYQLKNVNNKWCKMQMPMKVYRKILTL